MAGEATGRVRWLHLDGLEIHDGENRRQRDVLHGLVRAFRDGGQLAERRPDLVFCTGDVARSGQAAEYAVARHFFGQLQRALRLGPERFFVVPGEHDVDRTSVSRRFHLALGNSGEADEFFAAHEAGREDRAVAFRRFACFANFLKEAFELTLGSTLPYVVGRPSVPGRTIGVLGFNSAWLATGNETPGSLVVGERIVRDALERLDRDGRPDLVIALIHHPLEWLAEFEQSAVQGLLREGCDLLLHGHLDRQGPRAESTAEGDLVVAAFGRVSPKGGSPNALLGEVKGNELTLQAIVYDDSGGG
jgi:hypothetical protein